MLRLSKLTDYGTGVMSTLVHEPERSRSAAEIAAALHIPVTTVSKILKILAKGGLVNSVRGAKGGYLLARPASEITIADILHVMDGPIGMTECSVTPGLCAQEKTCVVRANWVRINQAVLGILQGVTLDQMTMPVTMPVPATVDVTALNRHSASSVRQPNLKRETA